MSLLDKHIGHYQILSKLGAGGMGEVYLAQDTSLNREELQKVIRDHPDFSTAHWGLGLTYEQQNNYDKALPELEKAAQRRGTNSLASLGHIYGRMGRKKEANDILSELKKRGETRDVSDYQLALVYIGLGETDAALEALEQAFRERATLMSYLKMDPRLDPLRNNQRFQELMRNMNFPQ